MPVSYTHLRAHETSQDLVCRLLLEKKSKTKIDKRKDNKVDANKNNEKSIKKSPIKEIVKEKKVKKDIPQRAKNDPRQKD